LAGITYDISEQLFLGLEGKYMWLNKPTVSASIVDDNGKVVAKYNAGEVDVNGFALMAVVGFRF